MNHFHYINSPLLNGTLLHMNNSVHLTSNEVLILHQNLNKFKSQNSIPLFGSALAYPPHLSIIHFCVLQ